jgi:hypothetical protein
MFKRCVLPLVSMMVMMTAASAVKADALDLNLNNDSVQLLYISPFTSNEGIGGANLEVGVIYTEADDYLGIIGLDVKGEAGSGSPGLVAGVGVRGYAIGLDTIDISALAIGGLVQYSPPALNRLSVVAQVFYAPEILTFMDGKHMQSVEFRVEYKILTQATVYLGYRDIEADLDFGGSVDIDDGGHLGLRFTF